jgi:hypothetical protein
MLSQHRSIGTLGETSALVSRLAEMKAEVSRLSASLSESAKESAETEILKNTTQMYLQDIKRYYSEDGGKKLVARYYLNFNLLFV